MNKKDPLSPTQYINLWLRRLEQDVWHQKRIKRLIKVQSVMYGNPADGLVLKEASLRLRVGFGEAHLRGLM